MLRKSLLMFCLSAVCALVYSQPADVKVCDVLAHPRSFDGKLVRVTGTVIAGFDEFVIKDTACGQPVNSIWLQYPEGTKAKSGPAAAVYLQLARNAKSTEVPIAPRTPVTLEANNDFKRFDAALASPAKMSGRCLGCFRSTVSATLTGRIDAVEHPRLEKDGKMFTAVYGFGNLARYPARLVVQSVSNVEVHDIDYSKPAAMGDGNVALLLSPEQGKRAMAAYGAQGEENGVVLNTVPAAILAHYDNAQGKSPSPDGLVFNVVFAPELSEAVLSEAMAHVGTHIADLREDANRRTLFDLEARAWSVTLLTAAHLKEKTFAAPGGYLLWNDKWSEEDRQKAIPGALSGFLTDWAVLGR